ncbi:MAG: hypothetical protein JXB07_11250 [Anaerolineae bacterium]|nr:hypothetical protein [Anaerolineae bacterium]
MTEFSEKPIQTPHHYHEIKWRLLAEMPWLVATLILVVILLSQIIVLSGAGDALGKLILGTIPQITIIGFLVIPMVMIVASGDADLSVGSLAGTVSCIAAASSGELGLGFGLAASLLVAFVVGVFHGLLVVLGRLKGIVITFATSFLLSGMILLITHGQTLVAPKMLVDLELARSPVVISLGLLLIIMGSALMILTPLGRRPRSGDPEEEGLAQRMIYKGLPFVFSSLMAWVSGILLLSWVGYGTISAGTGFTEMTLLAVLIGGTAYHAGTGFLFSAAFAVVAVVLLQRTIIVLELEAGYQKVITGIFMILMLPITHCYHVGVDWLYHRQTQPVSTTLPSGSQSSSGEVEAIDVP